MKYNTFRLLTLITFISIGCVIANAVETNDSTSTKTSTLDELVVEGRTQRVIKHGVEYIPGKKMKKMAMNAGDLLVQLMIPSLRSDLATKSVKSIDGSQISYFIDYIPAEGADLAGMRTEDVLRVEVLDNPDDPRFQGAKKVINFIMQKYEWGGYTKLYGQGTFLTGEYWNGSVYSKFSKKNCIFDLSVETQGTHDKTPEYSDDVETFKDINFQGKHFETLEKRTHSGDNKFSRHNRPNGLFRFTYFNNAMTTLIRHAVHLVNYNRFDRNTSSISFSDDVIPASFSRSSDKYSFISPAVTGEYRFGLPKRNYVSVNWSFRYDRIKNNSSYYFGADGTPDDNLDIPNGTVQNNYSPTINIFYQKNFGKGGLLSASLVSSNNIFSVDYDGSYDGKQDVVSSSNMLYAAYYYGLPFGLGVYPWAGVTYLVNRVDGNTKIHKAAPNLGLNLQYHTPNQKNFLSFNANWSSAMPMSSSTNSAIIRSNELLWIEGNPNLRTSNFTSLGLDYSLVPANWFNMYARLGYSYDAHRAVVDYYVNPDYEGLVARTLDNSDKHIYDASVSASFSLLNNSLRFQLTGDAKRVQITGINPMTRQWLRGQVSANYYYKNFLFSLSYASPEKAVHGNSLDEFSNTGQHYSLNISYSVKNFKASLFFSNWFNTYKKWTVEYSSPHYSYVKATNNRSRMLSINLSYTFTYGKKVNMNDEAHSVGNATSGALSL